MDEYNVISLICKLKPFFWPRIFFGGQKFRFFKKGFGDKVFFEIVPTHAEVILMNAKIKKAFITGHSGPRKCVMVTEDDAVAIWSMMYWTHTYDHRLIDGELGIIT